MKTRILGDGGKELSENLTCKFCKDGTINLKKAEKTIADRHSLGQMEKKERLLKRSSELNTKVIAGKVTAYDFYSENAKIYRELTNLQNVQTTIHEEVAVECPKCSKPAYVYVNVATEQSPDIPISNRDLIKLELASEDVLKRVAARIRMFDTFEEFQRWLEGGELRKSGEIIKDTVKKLNNLQKDATVQRLINALNDIPPFLEQEATQHRFDMLQEVKAQLYIDRPYLFLGEPLSLEQVT